MPGGLIEAMKIASFNRIKAELSSMRLDPYIRSMEAAEGSDKGLIFPFARGLRFSALLIYELRKILSNSDLEVDWGQIIDEDGNYCSGECDIVIHKKGYFEKWNGNDAGNHIMDFKFIYQEDAVAVISCKSYITKSRLEKEYCERMLNYVDKVWLFAECCGPDSVDLIKTESANIGYNYFWHLYTWSKNTGNVIDGLDSWKHFVSKIRELI